MGMWWWACWTALALLAGGCGRRRGGGDGDADGDGDGDGDIDADADGDGDGDGDSGLSRGDRVGALSESDAEALCRWSADQQGGPDTTHECDGFSVTVKSVSDCFEQIFEADCEATVGDVEDCMTVIDGDPCAMIEDFPPECGPLLSCGQAQP